MKLSYSLLPTALAIVILFSSANEAPAFGGPPGGPFSNGSYFPNDGTFSAVVRGKNLTGTLQFSTTSGAGPANNDINGTGGIGGLGSTGVATIYYEGDTYQGNSQGALNSAASTMTLNFQANIVGQGEQEITVVQPPDTRQILYFDSQYLSGYANCKTSNAFPNQKFKGNGEAYAKQLDFGAGNYDPVLQKIGPISLSVTGVRLSNSAASFNVSNTVSPSITTTTILGNP